MDERKGFVLRRQHDGWFVRSVSNNSVKYVYGLTYALRFKTPEGASAFQQYLLSDWLVDDVFPVEVPNETSN